MWVHTAGWDHASCGSPTRHHIVAMDLTDIWTLLIVGCTALLLAAVLAVVYLYLARQKEARWRQLAAVSEVARDWRTTWKINAVADPAVMEHEKDDIPSNFMLRIEENRIMRDIGGGEMIETRWRLPTKAEVREIVRRYHEAQAKKTQFRAIEFERPLFTGDHVDREAAVKERAAADDAVHGSVDAGIVAPSISPK
jgi:hypothetical protein